MNSTIHLRTARAIDLSLEEVGLLKKLTLADGEMREVLGMARRHVDDEPLVVIAQTDVIIGWALIEPGYSVSIFVDEAYRRQGVGTALMNEVLTVEGQPSVGVHDETSYKFYNNFHDVVGDIDGDYWTFWHKDPDAKGEEW